MQLPVLSVKIKAACRNGGIFVDKAAVLTEYFGHAAFRPGQEALVDAILQGRDALGVMPTGGGKSLCYQVPALLLPGLTLVVSPLISLMKDQVAALTAAGVPAAFINSSLTGPQMQEAYAGVRRGAYKLLYVAPERLEAPGFAQLLQNVLVSLLAVDEAHCISQWGQDFRPSYLRILEFIQALPVRPVVAAFTATATAFVQEDILRLLQLEDPVQVITGFDRPNLYFDVQRPQDKLTALQELIEARREKCGIVYCASRANVERVCDVLQRQGYAATRYHAGLSEDERSQNQEAFQYDRCRIMVATNAFGMGIDKSNVSYVIHYNMPKSIEAYYQEAGRAGRDGNAADCFLLFSPGDIMTAQYLMEHNENEQLTEEEAAAVLTQNRRRLDQMVAYCKSGACYRGLLLDYFGQEHPESCGNCGNCAGDFTEQDITMIAQMILSCIERVRKKLGYYVGPSLLAQVLRGSKNKRVLELQLDSVSTYGLLKKTPQAEVSRYMEALEAGGYCAKNEFGALRPCAAAAEVLFHGKKVTRRIRRQEIAKVDPLALAKAQLRPADAALLSALKEVRNRLAQQERVPGYIIFSNATLEDMARRCPQDEEALLEVSGVGRIKAARYGAAFLDVLRQYGEREAE